MAKIRTILSVLLKIMAFSCYHATSGQIHAIIFMLFMPEDTPIFEVLVVCGNENHVLIRRRRYIRSHQTNLFLNRSRVKVADNQCRYIHDSNLFLKTHYLQTYQYYYVQPKISSTY